MRFTALSLALVFACSELNYAQTTFGSITGTVTDATGSVLPGARVTAREKQSGYSYSAQTTATGDFTVPDLREGIYAITVSAPGFQELLVDNIQLAS